MDDQLTGIPLSQFAAPLDSFGLGLAPRRSSISSFTSCLPPLIVMGDMHSSPVWHLVVLSRYGLVSLDLSVMEAGSYFGQPGPFSRLLSDGAAVRRGHLSNRRN
jgi:hypothetical protein